MYRSTKELLATLPLGQLEHGSPAEAMAMFSAESMNSSITAAHTSGSEQLKRTPRKPYR